MNVDHFSQQIRQAFTDRGAPVSPINWRAVVSLLLLVIAVTLATLAITSDVTPGTYSGEF